VTLQWVSTVTIANSRQSQTILLPRTIGAFNASKKIKPIFSPEKLKADCTD